jgi:hypothetical protein
VKASSLYIYKIKFAIDSERSSEIFFYTDIAVYRRDIKCDFSFDFPASELKLNISLISDSILNSLLFLDSVGGDSKSISNLFKFIAAPVSS